MKLLTVSVISLLFCVHTSAQVKWDGGGGNNLWENPLNWENDILPVPTDDVLLDNSLLAGNYTIMLPAGATTVTLNTLTITPATGNITLVLPLTNTESPGLNITGAGDALILNTGGILRNASGVTSPGSGIEIANKFRINNGGRYIHNTDADNLPIVSKLSSDAGTETGIFEYNILSTSNYEISAAGQTYGSLVLSAVASGSSNYTISTGSIPLLVKGNFQVNANAHFTNLSSTDINVDGNFTLQNTSSSVNLSGSNASPRLTIKGNFSNAGTLTESGTGNPIVELAGAGTHNLSAPGTPVFSGDNLDFIVNTGGVIRLTTNVYLPHSLFVQAGTLDISDGTGNYTIGIKGDLEINGTITESGAITGKIELDGNTNQNITVSGTGVISGDQLNFVLKNTAGATLGSDLYLPYTYSIEAGNLTLGNYSLSTTRVVLAANPIPNHIITNGTGLLTVRNVGAAIIQFPVGFNATSVNIVDIKDGGGLDYSVRVMEGIVPAIANPLVAVDRTWVINSSGPLPSAPYPSFTFRYYAGDGQSGFDYDAPVDIGQNISGVWNLPALNPLRVFSSVDNEYRIAPLAGKITSVNSHFIIGNRGAILPIDFFIACKALKTNDTGIITWKIVNSESVQSFEVERAIDNSSFKSIATVQSDNKKLDYSFNDDMLQTGSNFYRIKTILIDGKIKYSNTVAIVHKSLQVLVTSVAPNPVQSQTTIIISAPARTSMRFALFDAQGRVMKQWQQQLAEGTNTMTLQMDNFKSGIYILTGTDGSIKTNQVRIVKQ